MDASAQITVRDLAGSQFPGNVGAMIGHTSIKGCRGIKSKRFACLFFCSVGSGSFRKFECRRWSLVLIPGIGFRGFKLISVHSVFGWLGFEFDYSNAREWSLVIIPDRSTRLDCRRCCLKSCINAHTSTALNFMPLVPFARPLYGLPLRGSGRTS